MTAKIMPTANKIVAAIQKKSIVVWSWATDECTAVRKRGTFTEEVKCIKMDDIIHKGMN